MLTTKSTTEQSFLAPYLRAANVQESGIDLTEVREMYFEPGEDKQFGLEAGDLLVVEGGSVGVAQIWNGTIRPCYIQNALHRVRAIAGYDARFLKYSLDVARYAGYIDLVCNKATIPHYTGEKLSRTPMVSPPYAEQYAIANYLDAKTAEIDGFIADNERAIELLREYRKSIISEAVTRGLDHKVTLRSTDDPWITEIPEHWNIIPLKYMNSNIESGTSVAGANWPADEDEKGVLTLSAVFQSTFDANQNKTVDPSLYHRLSCPLRKGALIISRCNTSEWVGTAAYVDEAPGNLYLPDKLWQLSFENDWTCRYVQYALQASFARNYFASLSVGASSSMQNIAKADLLAIKIAIPSNYDDVMQIVTYLDEETTHIDSLIADRQAMISKLQEYRKSLIFEAVTGKFKVPGVDD